jgi:hypothetical protein
MPSETTATQIAAWVGAGAAGLRLLWDVYKWARSGPKVDVNVEADMLPVGGIAQYELDKKFVMISATNVGEQPTTVTMVAGRWYRTWFQRLRRKPEEHFIISPLPIAGQGVPHLLARGERWVGAIGQSKVEEYLKSGRLECGVYLTGVKGGRFRLVVRRSTSNQHAVAAVRGAAVISCGIATPAWRRPCC